MPWTYDNNTSIVTCPFYTAKTKQIWTIINITWSVLLTSGQNYFYTTLDSDNAARKQVKAINDFSTDKSRYPFSSSKLHYYRIQTISLHSEKWISIRAALYLQKPLPTTPKLQLINPLTLYIRWCPNLHDEHNIVPSSSPFQYHWPMSY